MKNADMPAAPCATPNDPRATAQARALGVHVPDFNVNTGLTKREMMAMHICAAIVGSISSEECYQRIKSMSDNCGVKVSEWIARDATKQADKLLTELARTNGESK